jgi:hypothetical protein
VSHTCHAHGCSRKVPPSMFACKPHWFGLRKATRDAIWREYRPGQENDKQPSLRYLAVQRYAVMETAFKPCDEAAALTCAQYLLQARQFQVLAIKAGLGDPLAGLLPGEADTGVKP